MNKLNLRPAGAGTGSAAGIWSVPARINHRHARVLLPAPSVRVPPTRANRNHLRALRQAEMRAWKAASPAATLHSEIQASLRSGWTESWLIGGVAMVAASALVIGALSSLNFVAKWDRFVDLVTSLIG